MAPLNLDYLRLRAERASKKSDFLKLKKINNNKNICCLKSYVKKLCFGDFRGGAPPPLNPPVYTD